MVRHAAVEALTRGHFEDPALALRSLTIREVKMSPDLRLATLSVMPLGGKAREAADQALRSMRENAAGASGRFDKLEQVFEERVQKSLGRLGVLTRADLKRAESGQ